MTRSSTILSCLPGSLNAFALKLRPTDSVETIQSRSARKLAIPNQTNINLQYLYCDVYYTLEDDDDWEAFLDHHSNSPEVQLLLTSPAIPTSNPSVASISSASVASSSSAAADNRSVYSTSSANYGRHEPRDLKEGTRMHLVDSSSMSVKTASVKSGRSHKTEGTVKHQNGGGKAKSFVSTIPAHSIKFDEFHNQLGVRTFIGSIGPVQNVRMMMKSGHRACYMSRAFAQQNNFIPKDASPGYYGFSGITNLGNWPIKVGKKTVEQAVMLVENSYFPVILGRSFMERRGVRTDPLDQTSVVFMDTGEVVPTDLVVVKDASGAPVSIS